MDGKFVKSCLQMYCDYDGYECSQYEWNMYVQLWLMQ